MKKNLVFLIPLVVAAIFAYLPFFANPDLLLNRNNDLTEFFWPIFYYIKQNILENRQIPFWNNMFFAGTPLLPDPQNPSFYLPNIIFLFTNVDTAVLISLFSHTLFGSFGMYFASRQVFHFSKRTSIFVGIIFSLSPLPFSYLEAGHWGLSIAWNWLPYLLLSAHKLPGKPGLRTILLFAASASSIYFNHVLTALIVGVPVSLFWLYKRSFRFPFLGSLLTFIIISPAFLAQWEWQPQTTRSLLLRRPETFPVWRGKKEFLKTLFFFNPETEKAITFGVFPGLIASIGFLKLKRKPKVVLSTLLILLTLITLNNVSPLLPLLLQIDFFVLMRVTTRLWPLAVFIFLFLFGTATEKLGSRIGFFLGALAIVESSLIGYSYLLKPISTRENIPVAIYKILESDKTDFRVFCLSRCIPQKEAALNNLHLVEGYGTLQQKSYFYSLQKALNTSWDKYTLSIPPFEAYLYQELQPDAKLLLDLDTKYVISKYPLTDANFVFLGKFGNYYLYLNSLWLEDKR